jgi:hypothetical protein
MDVRCLGVAVVLFGLTADVLARDREPSWEARMIEQVNRERDRVGLPPLRHERRLGEAAAEHTRRMAEAGTLSHQLRGEPPLRARIAATGLRFNTVGENVGYSTDVEDLHPNLMDSRAHRENVLSPKYNAIGVAIERAGNRYYVTQNFARTTSEASVSDAGRALADAIERHRRRRGLPPVDVVPSRSLESAACDMARRDDVDAGVVPHPPGHRHVVVFTTFEPAELTRGARQLASVRDARRISLGVCHRATRRYPSGVFWVAAAY